MVGCGNLLKLSRTGTVALFSIDRFNIYISRSVLPWMGGIGLTPYAAAQAIAFDPPAYAESVVSGANTFALTYTAKTVTAPSLDVTARRNSRRPGHRKWKPPR
jgi:hypothetical protein